VRELWRGVDPFTHVHRFIDMHDYGDALLRAGFAEPVMDTERLTVTYRDLPALLGEIRDSGARNIAQGRPRGLTGRARGAVVQSRSEALSRNGPLRISVEVVHGHAWAVGERSPRRADGEVLVPIERLRTRRQD
jgi:malonyl-CoA O-methyltransferase